MKKKLILFIFIFLLLCGCTNIYNNTIDNIVQNFSKESIKPNTYRTGYRYYLPDTLSVKEYYLYNDVIESENLTFYLFVDLVSYFNKHESKYEINKDAYYSKILNFNEKNGYIEINKKENNQYLIEIMYNYAKIEVMVDKDNINLSIDYAITILNSIEYQDNIIANLVGNSVLNFEEKDYNMFNSTSKDSSYIKYAQEEQNENNELQRIELID